MKIFVQNGNVITLTAPYAVSSGGGALVGSIFGVAQSDVANAASGEFVVEGVLDLAKGTGALAAGVLVYWNDTTKVATGTASTNKLIGVVTVAALSGDTIVRVRLNGAFVS